MNRDEKLIRPTAVPPRKQLVNGRAVLCPSEPSGGAWIAVNDAGATLALINWYSIEKAVQCDPITRGAVVKSISSTDSPENTNAELCRLALRHINPFRLIGIFPASKEVLEWRWDLNRLIRKKRPWKAQQWVSSGFDEPTAQRVRSRTFRRSLRLRSAGRLDWLRRLHRSHAPEYGPFSTCMHRSDAATVSYTEIDVSGRRVKMDYHAGSPCKCLNCAAGPGTGAAEQMQVRGLQGRQFIS